MSKEWIKIDVPFSEDITATFKAGDFLLLSGILYTARDKAHERLSNMIKNNEKLPFDFNGQVIYYVGPSPTPEGKVIGAAGPTTSGRMDPFSKIILENGIKGMIGKGKRNRLTKDLLKEYNAVYLSSFGGAAAYLSKRIVSASIIAFEDLGPEAIHKLVVKDFPVVVINDVHGGALYEDLVSRR